MDKREAVLRYKTSMSVFKKWSDDGVITDSELSVISTKLAEKYGLSFCSIYLENDLLCKENRVIYGSAKGDRYEQKNHKT